MKSTRYEGGNLRQVLSMLVTDQVVCSRVAEQWPLEGMFDAKWANLVAGWCIKYVRQYNECPNGQLTNLFREWAEKRDGEEETIAAVEKFLSSLSDEHEQTEQQSTEYGIDLATKYFNRIRLKRESELLTEDLDQGLVDEPFERLRQLTKISLAPSTIERSNREFEKWRDACEEDTTRPLISFGGGAGVFFGRELQRGSLIALMAPDKTGKSFMLLEMAYQAARQGNRVLMVDAGDMGERDMKRRLISRVLRAPLFTREIRTPISISEDGSVEHILTMTEAASPSAAFKKFNKMCRGSDRYRQLCRPNSSLTVSELGDLISEMDRTEGWVPDVIVIDYADILAPPLGVKDPLEQIDLIWRHLRRMSQEKDALVITASQTSADAYSMKDGNVLTRRHFSGRKTKLAHVNGMLGINVTQEEKRNGVCRLNWVVSRSSEWSEYQVCRCAGSLKIASPIMVSRFDV